MKQVQTTTAVAGIDVSKKRLDAAVHGGGELQVANAAEGFAELITWLGAHGIGRIGLEASGGYERGVRQALEAHGLQVVVHQPLEVRLFARLKRLKAKNDRLDARLIAAATAQVDAVRAAQDPELAELAERLTAYEQFAEAAAMLKTCREHAVLDDLRGLYADEIARLNLVKRDLARQLFARIKARPTWLRRWTLLQSLPGFGPLVAAAALIRMPELGALEHGQAASLLGVAPFDRDSGPVQGRRVIAGGRRRPRRFVYLAALAAKRFNPALKTFAARLLARGKPAKLITIAVARKLIEAANLVLKRDHPWIAQPTT